MSHFSDVAREQLQPLRDQGGERWQAIRDALDLIFREPARARSQSTSFVTDVGLRLALPVVGVEPLKIFWSVDGPRVEAVFPYSR